MFSMFITIVWVFCYLSLVLLAAVVALVPHMILLPIYSRSLIPADMFDVVVIVGALSEGQVPVGVVREMCKSTKPGKTNFYTIPTQALKCLLKSFTGVQVCFKPTFILTIGGYVCMTTRCNHDNMKYTVSLKGELKQMEQEELWTCVEVTEVEDWERAVSEEEHGYIPGVVYLYKKLQHSAT